MGYQRMRHQVSAKVARPIMPLVLKRIFFSSNLANTKAAFHELRGVRLSKDDSFIMLMKAQPNIHLFV